MKNMGNFISEEQRDVNKTPLLSLIVPVFNEEAAISLFLERVENVFREHKDVTLEIVFVNDGSSDGTLANLLEKRRHDPRIVVVDLSRNFGKEAALSAGLQTARGSVVVPLDVDLQDPPELIPAMVAKWREGYEVVVGRRTRRDADSWAKRISARWFYRVHNIFADQKLPENVGDFRLMDRSVVDALNALPESCRFMKGLFAWVGFRTTCIDYARPARVAGESKFNAWRLWNFALDGITSFSTVPLRIWTYMGFVLAFTAFVFAVLIFLRVLISGVDVPGYASLMVVIIFFGGLQLIGIGILGEYLGRNYIESKRRPVFLIRKIYK
ncbi:MAG: glycosyltransferase family 2 protein [Desulfovibrio sp.]|uniref:glycosyltransferase family 2 protein n=1 Tax=Desulfovibrio sp. TaxID=885 RepID=UPI00258CEAE7|nr:glycosyltransferase family 2 protein [Desulfovibrio sp.]MCD7983523.1 glycosyltransferase family 2 protein [Desulfovibrio sp.]